MAALLAGCGHSSPTDTSAQLSQPGPFRSIAMQVALMPARAGSAGNPQPVRLDLRLKLGATRSGGDPPLLESLLLRLPAGVLYRGGSYPSCPQRTLNARGPGACPAGSVVGRGSIDARADTASAPGRITIVNGGATRLYLYTEIDRPARVQAPIVGTVTNAPRASGSAIRLAVPPELQAIAGIPIAVRALSISASRAGWLSTTSCPSAGSWTFEGEASFAGGSRAAQTTHVHCG